LKTYYQLIKTLEDDIKNLESKKVDILFISEQGIKLCKNALEQLRVSVIHKKFKSPEEETEFFKIIKPHVVSKLIYYVKRLDIESKRPKEGKKEQVKYLKVSITKLQSFFSNNLEFYHYYKSKANHFDEQYFLRANKTIRLNIEAYHFFTDENFSTSHDCTVATIIAYTKLIEYLKSQIAKINNINLMETINPFKEEFQLNWTGNNNELVELIYALYSSGKINNGNIDIKDITTAFEQVFKTDLGNYYQSFNDIRSRKINPTKFMDTLKSSLSKYMYNLDKLKE
tara:strand:+ start:15963 stop:16814 length:852 start_codon:yes stop_codon:yes gene_type:complete